MYEVRLKLIRKNARSPQKLSYHLRPALNYNADFIINCVCLFNAMQNYFRSQPFVLPVHLSNINSELCFYRCRLKV